MLTTLVSLCVFSFLAGLIDAVVGGGGLVQIPALLTLLPRELPVMLLGTNKFASSWGTLCATRSYLKRVRINRSLIFPAAAAAFFCAIIGAMTVSYVPIQWLRPLIFVLLIVMAIYTFYKKDFGALHRPIVIGRRERLLGMLLGGLIGFYDGLFGPGTGSFLVFLFICIFGFDFIYASACAKTVNLMTNIAALIFFVPAGYVLYSYALLMAACNATGALVGAQLAMRGGARQIRGFFLFLTLSLIGKLGYDMLSPHL